MEKLQVRPDLFFRDILGVNPELYQDRIALTVSKNQRTAIAACHDVGKSFTVARLALWFGTCFPRSKIITTAPTYNQVKNILWSELRTAHARSKVSLGGQVNLTEWKIDSDWFALGFTPKNELTGGEGQGSVSTFQGFHAEGGILVIFDEATGILKNIWNMAEGLLTQANVRFVAIGNPTSKNSEFFQCFRSPDWAKIYLSCFDSPNLRANAIDSPQALADEVAHLRTLSDLEVQQKMREYKVVRPYLLSTSWVLGRALKWGFEHPLFVSKVLGKFPEEGDNTLMPLGACEEAQRRTYVPLSSDRKTLGVDVARFGTDFSVLTYQHGLRVIQKKVFAKKDNMQLVGEVIAMCKNLGWPDVVVIDVTGLGSGVVDRLRELQRDRLGGGFPQNIEIRAVQFGAAPMCSRGEGCKHELNTDCDKAKYANIKARMFDLLAQDLKSQLCLLDEDVYLEELPTILYAYDSKGRLVIESKDEYKKRTGRNSPDHADSLALANYGRYDESRVGGILGLTQDAPPPMSGGLHSGDRW